MKKVLISLFLLISTLMLSSCQVNWFGSHFDVPWYFIAVPVFVLFIVLYVIIVSKTYVCPKCKTEFKPKWYQIYITIHFNDSRIAKCPNCGRKGFCKRKDQCHLFCQHAPKNPENSVFRIFSFVSAGHNIICVAHATSFELQLNIIPPQADTNERCCLRQMMCFAMM